jgi:hypothetical protein
MIAVPRDSDDLCTFPALWVKERPTSRLARDKQYEIGTRTIQSTHLITSVVAILINTGESWYEYLSG